MRCVLAKLYFITRSDAIARLNSPQANIPIIKKLQHPEGYRSFYIRLIQCNLFEGVAFFVRGLQNRVLSVF